MKNTIETYGMQELSSKELKSISGGYDLIQYIVMGIGYMNGASDSFWESNNSGGYVGCKL